MPRSAASRQATREHCLDLRNIAVTRIVLAILISLGTAGCATHSDRLHEYRDAYFTGRIEHASSTLERVMAESKQDVDVLALDRAMIELMSGETRKAEQTLRAKRDRLDFLEQTDAREVMLSMVKDDNSRAWAGDDYERVLIRVFLALTNLMHGGEDAGAYALQIASKQDEVIARIERDRPPEEAHELPFKRIALGPYVHAALLEERHTDYDDIERSRLKVVNWETDFRDAQADLERARFGRHSQPGNGVLYVFGLVGRGPYKEEVAEVPTSLAMLLADRILSNILDQELPPTIAPVLVPRVRPGRSLVSDVEVFIDGESAGTTATITDVSRFAVSQSQADFDATLARAIVRRTLKKGAIYAAKDHLGAESLPLADLALSIAGVAWEATENADTRCWGLLPDKIQVCRIELPAGEHHMSLQPRLSSRAQGKPQSRSVTIADGRNTYMLVNIPDREVIGSILVSD